MLTFVTRRSTSEATKLPSPCMAYSFFCLYSSIRDARALCSMSYIAIAKLRRACASLHSTIQGGLRATAEALTRTRDSKRAQLILECCMVYIQSMYKKINVVWTCAQKRAHNWVEQVHVFCGLSSWVRVWRLSGTPTECLDPGWRAATKSSASSGQPHRATPAWSMRRRG